ncbi:MAG: histidine kinase dimerization/phospho-acceptor domain-containing protein, partial [Pseudomonadales bacterium]
MIRFDGVVLFDSSQVASSMSNHRDRPELLQARALGIGRAERFSSTLNQELLYVAKPVWSNNALIGFVRVATPTALMEQAAIEEARWMALMSFLLGCLLLAAFAFYSNRQIQALKEIESSLHALTEGNFSSRAHLQTNQAFIATFQALNQLARKLQSQKEAQLADDAHFETVVETLKEGILLINEDQRIELINPSAARLLEISSERLQGHPLWGNLALGVLIDLVDTVRTSGRPARQSLEIFDRTVLAEAYGVAAQSSVRASILVVLQDITERTRMDEMREDFMRSASHELRTPLTAILGFVHTIIDDPDMPPSLL